MELEIGQFREINLLDFRENTFLPRGAYLYSKRVLFFDEYEVFLDTLIDPESKVWGTSSWKKGKCYFARMSRKKLLDYSKVIDFFEVNDDLLLKLHSHLLFRICRLKSIEWDSELFTNTLAFSKFISNNTDQKWKSKVIKCSHIYITPHSKSGSELQNVLIEAKNGRFFTAEELLWKAGEIQNRIIPQKIIGIGLYRSGNYKGLPTYYTGGFYDLANILEEYENTGVDILDA